MYDYTRIPYGVHEGESACIVEVGAGDIDPDFLISAVRARRRPGVRWAMLACTSSEAIGSEPLARALERYEAADLGVGVWWRRVLGADVWPSVQGHLVIDASEAISDKIQLGALLELIEFGPLRPEAAEVLVRDPHPSMLYAAALDELALRIAPYGRPWVYLSDPDPSALDAALRACLDTATRWGVRTGGGRG